MKKYKLTIKERTFALTLINDLMSLISPYDKKLWQTIGYVDSAIGFITGAIDCFYETTDDKDVAVRILYSIRETVDEKSKEIEEMKTKLHLKNTV